MDNVTLNGIVYRGGKPVQASLDLTRRPDGTWHAKNFDDILKDTHSTNRSRSRDTYEPETAHRTELAEQEIGELAGKYDTSHMTQEQYDAFLDELVEKGTLSRSDTMYLGHSGLKWLDIDAGKFASGGSAGWGYVHGDKLARTLEDAEGDLTVWMENMMARLERGIDPSTKEGGRQKTEAVNALRDIVKRIRTENF